MLSRCSLVVGDIFPVHPTERFALNGKVKVMLTRDCGFATRVCYREMVLMWAYLGDIIRAVLSWDPCLRGLSGW